MYITKSLFPSTSALIYQFLGSFSQDRPDPAQFSPQVALYRSLRTFLNSLEVKIF